ncbi:MAG: enoyl-CoA hydratase-related protein [Burkholderiaceae bacterium]
MTITLNRPDVLNSLDEALTLGLIETMNEAKTDSKVRSIIVTGAGRAFCAGADLNARSWPTAEGISAGEATAANMERGFNPLIKAVAQSTKPVVTAINGVAAGGGVGLAVAGDIAIAAESASFKLVFGPNLGIIPDMGASWFLPNLVGRARANGLALLGDNLLALDAKTWGLIWDCVPDEDLMSSAKELAGRLADGPTAGLKAVVKAHDRAFSNTLSEQLEYEKETQRMLFDFPHVSEGIRAFIEKRKPNFRNVS